MTSLPVAEDTRCGDDKDRSDGGYDAGRGQRREREQWSGDVLSKRAKPSISVGVQRP